MKKMLIVSLCLALAVFTVSPVFAGAGAQGGGKAKEVVVFMENTAIRDDFIDEFYKDFTASTGYKVTVINGGGDAEYRQNLAIALNGGQQIDVLFCNGQAVRPYATRGIIEDLTNQVGYWNRFQDSSIAAYTFDSKRYAVPVNRVSTSGVFVNMEVLRKYNLGGPKNYDDLLKIRDTVAKDGISVFGFGGGGKYMWPTWFFVTFAQTSGNRSAERTVEVLRGQGKFTDKDYVDAMAVLERMGKDNLFPPGFNGMDSDQGLAVFTSDKAALCFGLISGNISLREYGMTGDKLDLVPFPIVAPGAKPEHCGSAGTQGICLVANLPQDRKDIALKLIDYTTSDLKVQQKAEHEGEFGPFPNKAFKSPANVDPLYSSMVIPVLATSTVTFLDWTWPAEVTTAFQDQIQAVTGGQTTAPAAMAAIQKVLDELVANGYKF
jgi:raffinose/stachyose/melibiose transport system substrate-binding protein